jgi:hypothetical protein
MADSSDASADPGQRMVVIEFGFPPAGVERQIMAAETGVDDDENTETLVRVGHAIRRLARAGVHH